MGTKSLTLYCTKCGTDTGHSVAETNHVLHLLLAVLTAGIWLIVWIIIAASTSSTPRCSHCGNLYNPRAVSQAKAMQQQTRKQETRPCPFCAEDILMKAVKCKHCGSEVAA